MDTLYIDCRMGINAVKFLGALIDMMENPDLFVYNFNKLNMKHIAMQRLSDAQNGVKGSQVEFIRRAATEFDPYADEIDDDGDENAEVEMPKPNIRTLSEVLEIIDEIPLKAAVRDRATRVYKNIARVTAKANNLATDNVKMYRTGSRDIIAAVVGVCIALDELKPERIVSSIVAVGEGYSFTPRGMLPVPIPEIQILFEDVPHTAGVESGELCSLDGAALIAEITDEFASMPEMTLTASGVGFGRRNFKNGLNCVRTYRGNALMSETSNEAYIELCAETYGLNKADFAKIGAELEELGVVSAYVADICDLKGNPGLLLKAVTTSEKAAAIATYIMEKTGVKRVTRSLANAYTS